MASLFLVLFDVVSVPPIFSSFSERLLPVCGVLCGGGVFLGGGCVGGGGGLLDLGGDLYLNASPSAFKEGLRPRECLRLAASGHLFWG